MATTEETSAAAEAEPADLLRRVVEELDLTNDPEFAPSPWLPDFLRASDRPADAADLARTVARRVTVTRQERSYVVSVSAWASDAALSARLTNAIAETFRAEIVRADAELTQTQAYQIRLAYHVFGAERRPLGRAHPG